jgi:eukaryotic-like serine/threonine-protein kinase
VSDDATKLPDSFGATIGPYEIISVLRRGMSSTIYLAISPASGREVALKVGADAIGQLSSDRHSEHLSVAKRLVHRHIVRVFHAGTDAGLSYIVMERLRGRTLRELIDETTSRLDLATRIDLAAQLCVGLHFAHEHGVVHGDVTPENVFVTDENVVKILNFGTASTGDRTVVSDNALSGFPYTAPEQARGREALDGRADVFAVGAILHELVTGRPPSRRDTTALSLAPILHGGTTPLEAVTKLEIAIRRALDEDPAKRFASAQELAYALWMVHLPFGDAGTKEVEGPGETLYVERSVDHTEPPVVASEVDRPGLSKQAWIYVAMTAVMMVVVAVGLFSC